MYLALVIKSGNVSSGKHQFIECLKGFYAISKALDTKAYNHNKSF